MFACFDQPPLQATFDIMVTRQFSGAVTMMSKVAFRSGWSKQANIRLASAVSNWGCR